MPKACPQKISIRTVCNFSESLIDTANDVYLKEWILTSADMGDGLSPIAWSVRKRRLSGGRKEGVDIIEVDNRALKFTVVPTRGFNVWSAHAGDLRLGWDSLISTVIGTHALTLNDTFTNLADAPQEWESLYHINFGPPLLGPGAEVIAPVKKVVPRDSRAAQGNMIGWNVYTGPSEPGYTEQVYFMELFADSDLMTQAMLRSPDRKCGALLSFSVRELPFMTLWKNEAPSKTGYVTGLEPSTSYPFARPIERAAGRLQILQGGESYQSKVTIRALVSEEEVQIADNEIRQKSEFWSSAIAIDIHLWIQTSIGV